MADHPNQVSNSPYNYGANNPVFHTDPDGKCPPWICGAIVGAGVEYGSQVAANMYENGFSLNAFTKGIDLADIGLAALEGGATGGISAVRRIVVKGTVKVGVEITKNAFDVSTDGEGGVNTQVNSLKKTAIDTGVGLTLNGIGASGLVKNGKLLKVTTAKETVKAAKESGQVVTKNRREAIEIQANAKLDNVKEVNNQTQTAAAQTATGAVSERLKDTHNQQD